MDELMDLKRADTLGKAPSCFYYVETIEEMRAMAHELLEAGEPYTLKMLAINGGDLICAVNPAGVSIELPLELAEDLKIQYTIGKAEIVNDTLSLGAQSFAILG